MRLVAACVALLLLAAAGSAQARILYFVGDRATNRWCVFATKGPMLAEEERLQDAAFSAGVMTGEAELDGRAIVRLEVAAGPQSGDWVMIDTYRLRDGRVVAVERTTGYASGAPFRPSPGVAASGSRIVTGADPASCLSSRRRRI